MTHNIKSSKTHCLNFSGGLALVYTLKTIQFKLHLLKLESNLYQKFLIRVCRATLVTFEMKFVLETKGPSFLRTVKVS